MTAIFKRDYDITLCRSVLIYILRIVFFFYINQLSLCQKMIDPQLII